MTMPKIACLFHWFSLIFVIIFMIVT
uniref:Uncharacterized protein n=1 Tax=Anguilla anguilla TaxID=7936 RepID=A0A0E9SUY5_ANGAN